MCVLEGLWETILGRLEIRLFWLASAIYLEGDAKSQAKDPKEIRKENSECRKNCFVFTAPKQQHFD